MFDIMLLIRKEINFVYVFRAFSGTLERSIWSQHCRRILCRELSKTITN
jgi:hypothetical protein